MTSTVDPGITSSVRHHALLATGERELATALDRAQRAYLAEARAAILGTGTGTTTAAGGDPRRFGPRDPRRLTNWPSTDRWRSLLAKHVLAPLKRWYRRAFGTGHAPPAELLDAFDREYRAALGRDTWADTVHDEATAEIEDSRQHGDSLDMVRDRITRLLSPNAPVRRIRDQLARAARNHRAHTPELGDTDHQWRNDNRTRARWLTVGAYNKAALDRATADQRTTGDQLVKRWMCTHDERTRTSHRTADTQTVPLARRFRVGGAELRFPADPLGPPAEVINCRCTLTVHSEDHDMSDTDTTEDLAASATTGETTQLRWRGMLAPLDTRADHRVIGLPEDGEVQTNERMWLSHQETGSQGHDGKRRVGRIDRAWIENGKLYGEGVFNPNREYALGVARDIRDGFDGTVSVDLADGKGEEKFFDENGVELDPGDMDEATFAQKHPDARKLTYYSQWRLSGATLVQDPAFHTGYVELINEDGDSSKGGGSTTAGAGRGGVSNGKRKRAEKKGMAMPGGRFPIENREDLHNAIQALGRAAEGDREKVKAHIRSAAKKLGLEDELPDGWSAGGGKQEKAAAEGSAWAQRVAQVAWDRPEPPADAFTNPLLSKPTKITVTDDARVYGHIACWESSHIGFTDRDVRPPSSETGYAMFHRHPVRCDNGQRVKTGALVMGTSHADLTMSTSAASSHYDHTGHVVADVVAGEDEHGIWVAGHLHPDVTPLQVTVLDRYSLSGDWRGGELVSALVVNTPGFPIPDTLAASGEIPDEPVTARVQTDDYGDTYALVAAGMLAPAPEEHPSTNDLADELRALREELAAEREHRETMAARTRVDGLVNRVHGNRLERIEWFAAGNSGGSGGDARPKRAGRGEDVLNRIKKAKKSKKKDDEDEDSGGKSSKSSTKDDEDGDEDGEEKNPPAPEPEDVAEQDEQEKQEQAEAEAEQRRQQGLLDDQQPQPGQQKPGKQPPKPPGQQGQQPPGKGGQKPPSSGGGKQQPKSSGGQKPPSSGGGKQKPPAAGGQQQPPKSGGAKPAGGGGQQKGQQKPPSGGGSKSAGSKPPSSGSKKPGGKQPAPGGQQPQQQPPAEHEQPEQQTEHEQQPPQQHGGQQPPAQHPDQQKDQGLLDDGDTGPLPEDWDILATLDELDEHDIQIIEELTGDQLANPNADGAQQGGESGLLDGPDQPDPEEPHGMDPHGGDQAPADGAHPQHQPHQSGQPPQQPAHQPPGQHGGHAAPAPHEQDPRRRRAPAVAASADAALTAASKPNWVDQEGGLPKYVKRIARHLKEKGMTESHAIATAINVAKKMCGGRGGGDRLNWPGAQRNVNAGSIAHSCSSIAKWEAMKAKRKAKGGGGHESGGHGGHTKK